MLIFRMIFQLCFITNTLHHILLIFQGTTFYLECKLKLYFLEAKIAVYSIKQTNSHTHEIRRHSNSKQMTS